MNPLKLVQITSVSAVMGFIAACGSSSSGTSSDSYNGPGSKWDVELSANNTFYIERRETPQTPVDMTVNGNYERYNSGFLGLTVTSATADNPSDAPSAGDTAWALEVPGYALLLKPMGDDKIIAMVQSGNCPTDNIDANWVIVKQDSTADASDNGRDYFGTFNYDHATGAPTLPSKFALAGGFTPVTSGGLSGTGTCEDGLMFVGSGSDIAAMYLTQNGGAIVQTNINDEDDSQFIFALAQKEISDIANIEGDYAGMLFDDNMADGSTVNPVALSCDNAGTCTGTLVADISTGALDTGSVTVTLNGLEDALGNGFITGLITDDDSNTGNLSCMVDINANGSTQNIVNCVGQSPGDNSKMFNVMFVSI